MGKATWSEKERAVLRESWGVISSTAIGERLGRSKGAVIGEAHRLELPLLRPSRGKGLGRGRVINRQPPPAKPPKIERAPMLKPGAASLPPLPSAAILLPSPAAIAREAAKAAPAIGPVNPCCWPIGERRKVTSCDAPSLPGKPYCDEHNALAYGKKRRKRDAEPEPKKQPPGGRLTAWGMI